MLSRSGPLPLGAGWAYELKLDGFRAIVRSGDRFQVRSRRGWNMTSHLAELAALPVDAVLDGELVAPGDDGWPDFPRLCRRMLQGDRQIQTVFVAFDLLELDGQRVTHLPLSERRSLLDSLELHGPAWQTSALFDDPEALWQVCVDHGLEGVVAKRLRSPYRPGERGWVKTKNRSYWRYPLELAAMERRLAASGAFRDAAASRLPAAENV